MVDLSLQIAALVRGWAEGIGSGGRFNNFYKVYAELKAISMCFFTSDDVSTHLSPCVVYISFCPYPARKDFPFPGRDPNEPPYEPPQGPRRVSQPVQAQVPQYDTRVQVLAKLCNGWTDIKRYRVLFVSGPSMFDWCSLNNLFLIRETVPRIKVTYCCCSSKCWYCIPTGRCACKWRRRRISTSHSGTRNISRSTLARWHQLMIYFAHSLFVLLSCRMFRNVLMYL